MKRLIIFICLIAVLPLCGCVGVRNNANLGLVIPETEFMPDFDAGGEGDGESEENDMSELPTVGEKGDGNGIEPPKKEENFGESNEKITTKLYAISTANGLRVRSSDSTNASVLGSLDRGDAVVLLGESNGFIKTVYKERTAYVSAAYCTVLEVETSSLEVEKAIDEGCKLLGYPYVWGSQRYHWGNGKLNANFVAGEFDCSALVQYVYYKSNGVILDVTSRAQSNNGVPIARENLSRGDLMFFTNASRKDKTGVERIGHVGIYFGNNYILHTASDHAVIEPISSTRWGYYVTARRVL
jgi:cell wall-associated NlpC family hydrolase